MGEDTPEAVILTCPGCDTQFRLRPKKGRLPDGPVACPKCATDIPVVDSNISEPDADDAPQRATLSGDGPVPPSANLEQDEDGGDELDRFPDGDHSFADINLSENASQKTGPKQTFLGMGPSSLKAVMGDEGSSAGPDEPTQLVDRENLGALRESSVVDETADDGGFKESPTSGRLRRPRQLDEEEASEFTRETSEQRAVAPSDLRETAENQTFDEDSSSDSFEHAVDEDIDAADDADSDDLDTGSTDSDDERTTAADVDTSTEPDEADDESDSEEDASSSPPKKNVLGKLKLKKKLAARLKKDKKERQQQEKEQRDEEQQAAEPAASDSDESTTAAPEASEEKSSDKITLDSEDQKTGKKPSLSELLKKARKKSKSKGQSGLPRPSQSTTKNKRPQPTGEKLDRALQDIADETAKALTDEESEAREDESRDRHTERLGKVGGTERLGKVSGPEAPSEGKRSSKEMMDLLRRKVAEKDQPGAASERRGSGYIRLPTAEIQDVLGQGTYRLRVENIVYEPVDKEGLTKLIKRGVLLGAADIAKGDGDWMPVQEHPVFHELRSKMAQEAHDLLADYRAEEDASADDVSGAAPVQPEDEHTEEPSGPPPRPEPGDDQAGEPTSVSADAQEESDQPVVETVSEDEATGIPTIEADLEEPEEEEPVASSDQSFDLPKSESSIEFPVDDPEAKQPAGRPDEPEPTAEPEPAPSSQDGTPKSYPAIDPSRAPEEPEAPAAASEPAQPAAKSGGRRGLIIALSILAVAMVTITIAVSPIGRPYVEQYLGPIGLGSDDDSDSTQDGKANAPTEGQPDPAVGEAVAQASSDVADAADIPMSSADGVAAMVDDMVEAGDTGSAATLMGVVRSNSPEDPALARQHIDLLIESGRFTRARHLIARQVANGNDTAALQDAFASATSADPALGDYKTVSLTAGRNADALRAYPTWETMNFQVVEGGTITGLFKPAQNGWEDAWRDEIAAWRLCEIMVCHFEVPRNRAARITRAELEKLVDAGNSDAQQAYRDQLDNLDWQTESTDQGDVEVVYGTLKDWPGEWAPFPIELTDIWRPWLSIPGADLDQPLRQVLAELENVQDGRFYREIMDEANGATPRSMSRELSTILVFDYLTNNWDRFVSDEDRYGVNNGFADGHFVSLNNGTAFQTRDSTRVKGRFSWTSRFSQSTIASLTLMKPDFVSAALYPNPSGLDEVKLEVFWEQRDRALERVEELSQARGADAVMAFD